MQLSDQLNQEIENYLSGEMQEGVKKDFEAKLAKSKDLQNALGLEQSLRDTVISNRESELKNVLKDIHRDLYKAEDTNKKSPVITKDAKTISLFKSIYPILGIAASVLLIAGAFYFFPMQNQNIESLDIDQYIGIESNYSHEIVADLGVRGDMVVDEGDRQLKEIFEQINESDFKSANELLGDYLKVNTQNQFAQYAQARLFLDNKNYDQAMLLFDELRQSEDRSLRNEAEFYYGLSHLKIKNGAAKAKVVLESVAKNDRSVWNGAANQILETLKN